jgi:hypothetical protein
MQGTRNSEQFAQNPRRFREEVDEPGAPDVDVSFSAVLPLEVNMTDEPGGDPYNHTGRFRRMFR